MNAATPVIEARGLHVAAGTNTLLRGLGLAISTGERVAIVGSNGAGKSTLLRAIAGFCAPSGGSLRVLGTELAHGSAGEGAGRRNARVLRALRCRIAQVHQGLQLVGRLSALDNVLIGGAGRNGSPWTWARRWPANERQQANAALARVGVAWAAGRRVDSLSGGERQKVAIARALHQQAELLLADEPTASLDADAAAETATLLGDVASESGATLVCVLHDMALLPRLADRVVVLRGGEIVADLRVAARGAGTAETAGTAATPETAETVDRLRALLRSPA